MVLRPSFPFILEIISELSSFPFFILKPKENKIATESRGSVSQVLSDPLYSRELFHYNRIDNGKKEWEVLNLCIFLDLPK